MRPTFFKSLESAKVALEKAFQSLRQRKIDGFSASTIDSLVKDDDEALSHISLRPSIIITNSMPKLSSLIKDITRLNPGLLIKPDSLDKDVDAESLSFFRALGISSPTPL